MLKKLRELIEAYKESFMRSELPITKCDTCGGVFYFPSTVCRFCFSSNISIIKTSGKGKIYSYTELFQLARDKGQPPVAAIVELEEGAKLYTNIIKIDQSKLHIGMSVQATFLQAPSGVYYPVFEPTT